MGQSFFRKLTSKLMMNLSILLASPELTGKMLVTAVTGPNLLKKFFKIISCSQIFGRNTDSTRIWCGIGRYKEENIKKYSAILVYSFSPQTSSRRAGWCGGRTSPPSPACWSPPLRTAWSDTLQYKYCLSAAHLPIPTYVADEAVSAVAGTQHELHHVAELAERLLHPALLQLPGRASLQTQHQPPVVLHLAGRPPRVWRRASCLRCALLPGCTSSSNLLPPTSQSVSAKKVTFNTLTLCSPCRGNLPPPSHPLAGTGKTPPSPPPRPPLHWTRCWWCCPALPRC